MEYVGWAGRVAAGLAVRHARAANWEAGLREELRGDTTVTMAAGPHVGADELVFYDITASPEGRSVDRSWIARIASTIFGFASKMFIPPKCSTSATNFPAESTGL